MVWVGSIQVYKKKKRIKRYISFLSKAGWLDIWMHFSSERMVKHWNRHLREVIDAPRLSVVKRHLNYAPNKVFWFLVSPGLVRQLDQKTIVNPFQMKETSLF